ncbi:uncharacterized protein LOC133729001 [Rosa rugosa]|uniref:uncharacterized protein LOC133729001 n=1 Tax=Rosa rugosa TaxID=74645 RepID=UPI002B4036B4|nr:uncharacterized protein LOC133729001 [Rosa rugosa]XP_062012458.1 uncharacterized protein LOC133729001 [Rosa rugosa]
MAQKWRYFRVAGDVPAYSGEVAPPPGTTKLPKLYYSQVTCTICKKKGHNMRTCKSRNQEENNVQQEEQVNVQEQGAENVQHEEAVHVEEEGTVNVTQHEAHIAQQQESQPAFLPTQQFQTSTTQEGSSMPQFKHTRFKSLAQRKPKPKNAPPSPATSDE